MPSPAYTRYESGASRQRPYATNAESSVVARGNSASVTGPVMSVSAVATLTMIVSPAAASGVSPGRILQDQMGESNRLHQSTSHAP